MPTPTRMVIERLHTVLFEAGLVRRVVLMLGMKFLDQLGSQSPSTSDDGDKHFRLQPVTWSGAKSLMASYLYANVLVVIIWLIELVHELYIRHKRLQYRTRNAMIKKMSM